MVIAVVTEFARKSGLNEFPYADDIVLMSETIEAIGNKFIKWKEAFENKGLKVKLVKTKVMVSSGITQDGLSKNTVEPCTICSLRLKANSVLCAQCGMLIHGKCTGVKRVTPKFSRNFTCKKC